MTTDVAKVLAERGSNYGRYDIQTQISQSLKRVMEHTPRWSDLTDYQRDCLEMWAVKVSRVLNGNPNYVDNWRDMEGYARLVADLLEGKSQ